MTAARLCPSHALASCLLPQPLTAATAICASQQAQRDVWSSSAACTSWGHRHPTTANPARKAAQQLNLLRTPHQLIGGPVQVHAHLVAVQVARDMPELHPDLCSPGVQGLASLEQEGHAIPARVVDEHGHRCEGWAQAAAWQVSVSGWARLTQDVDEHGRQCKVWAQAAAGDLEACAVGMLALHRGREAASSTCLSICIATLMVSGAMNEEAQQVQDPLLDLSPPCSGQGAAMRQHLPSIYRALHVRDRYWDSQASITSTRGKPQLPADSAYRRPPAVHIHPAKHTAVH